MAKGLEKNGYKNGDNLYQEIVKILIYNRPLTFYGDYDYTGKIYPKNKENYQLLKKYPYFEPYYDTANYGDNNNARYELIALSALFGASCKSFVINDGNRRNQGVLNTKYFNKNNRNQQTKAYICGLVGARFENEKQMEAAYIGNKFSNEKYI